VTDPLAARPEAAAARRLDVLFVHTPTRPPLGADTWIHLQIARRLDRSQFGVHVACVPATDDGPTPTFERLGEIDDVSIVPVGPGPTRPSGRSPREIGRALAAAAGSAVTVAKLARYIRVHDIAVVDTSDRPRDALLCVALSKLTRAKSVVHVHVLYKDWMSRPLRSAITRADARVGVSEFVRTSLTDAGMSPDDSFAVLNGIDLEEWQPGVGRTTIRAELAIPDDAPVVVTACRLFKEKGTAELIEAVARVRADHPDVRLLVVGHDTSPGQEFLGSLRELVDRLDLGDRVVFTGRRPDVAALMAAADVFAMPSFEEPFGLVFAEAMAMELPVVALRNGGTLEVVAEGRTGLLSDPGDGDALAANLATLLDDPDLRRRMGAEGRRCVEDRFTIDRMAADTEDVYRSVAGDRRAPSPAM
jgi:glycosyltransferase involved in cell wall biosynthesis